MRSMSRLNVGVGVVLLLVDYDDSHDEPCRCSTSFNPVITNQAYHVLSEPKSTTK